MAVIIITGVSGGIGKAVCEYLLTDGNHTVIGLSGKGMGPFRNSQAISASISHYHHFQMDIRSRDDISRLVQYLKELKLYPDILINNAGMMLNKPFMEISQEEMENVITVNLKAPFMMIQALVPMMPEGGHIVNITSMGGVQGSVKFPGLSLYSATKGALSILTEALAEELKEKGIRVNAIAPGSVQTRMLEVAFPGYKAPVSPEEFAAFLGHFALHGHKIFNGKVLSAALGTP
jgi:3-oxoacyl-[acyl-carrier protein] reductase